MSVPKRVTPLVVALFFFLPGFTQSHNSQIKDSERYRLDLPKEWNRRKLIIAITDILPKTIDKLKNRDFCTKGKAAFYVRIIIDSLSVYDIKSIPSNTFSFNYSFHAALLVTDSLENPVSMLRLVARDETMNYSKNQPQFQQYVISTKEIIYDSIGARKIGQVGEGSRVIVKKEIYDMPNISPSIHAILTEKFLLTICEQRIFQIKEWLKEIIPD